MSEWDLAHGLRCAIIASPRIRNAFDLLNKSLLISDAPAPPAPGETVRWGRLIGASAALLAAELVHGIDRPVVVLAEDPRHADQLEAEIAFFAGPDVPVLHFVEWETLPWDSFSPHQDIISQRLRVLSALPTMSNGVIVAAYIARLRAIRMNGVTTMIARSIG